MKAIEEPPLHYREEWLKSSGGRNLLRLLELGGAKNQGKTEGNSPSHFLIKIETGCFTMKRTSVGCSKFHFVCLRSHGTALCGRPGSRCRAGIIRSSHGCGRVR